MSIEFIGTSSGGRPARCARALESFLGHARRHGRQITLVVMDNSVTEVERRSYVEQLTALTQRSGCAIDYAGHDERREFVGALARLGIEPQVAELALGDPLGFGTPIGAGRNAFMLHTIDSLALCVDDDTICRPHVPRPTHAVRIYAADSSSYGRHDPQTYHCYESRAEVVAASSESEVDVLAVHESVLGRACCELLAQADPLVDDAHDERFSSALRQPEARVSVTTCGSYGDVGFKWPTWLLLKDEGDGLRRLGEPPHRLEPRLAAGEVRRMVWCPTVTDGRFCQEMFVAYDGRCSLPPYCPVGRAEGGPFAFLLARCSPGQFMAHVPLALLHEGAGPRVRGSFEGLYARPTIRVGEVLDGLMHALAPRPTPGVASLDRRALGMQLVELAADATELERVLQRAHADARTRLAEHVERLIERGAGGPGWRSRALALRDAILASLCRLPSPLVPSELSGRDDALEARNAFVAAFGRLLAAWDDLRCGARELNAKGRRLGRRIG